MESGESRTPRNIVIADSSTACLDGVCKAFEVYGHKIFTATTGLEALQRTEYFTPDAMIVELGLPQLNGFEVAQAIRSQTRFDQTLLIASTSELTLNHLGRAAEHGYDWYVPKPFNHHLLHEAFYAPRQERMRLLSTQMLKQTRQLVQSMRSALKENRELRAHSRRLLELIKLLHKKFD